MLIVAYWAYSSYIPDATFFSLFMWLKLRLFIVLLHAAGRIVLEASLQWVLSEYCFN